jgi:hypothetical protein
MSDDGEPVSTLTVAEQVEAMIDYNAIKPGFEAGFTLKIAYIEVYFYKNILGRLLCLLLILEVVEA